MAGLADPPVGHPIGDPVQADPAASGTRRCTASSFVPPHVTASPRRPSPRLARDVDDPSGDGSAGMMAWGLEGVEKIERRFWTYNWNRRGGGRVLCTRRRRFPGTRSPPLRGRCLRSKQRGVWLRLSRARIFWEGSPPSVTYGDISPARGEIGGLPRPVRLPTEWTGLGVYIPV